MMMAMIQLNVKMCLVENLLLCFVFFFSVLNIKVKRAILLYPLMPHEIYGLFVCIELNFLKFMVKGIQQKKRLLKRGGVKDIRWT